MKTTPRIQRCAVLFGALLFSTAADAQTSGSVSLTATLSDTGSGPDHWTVVWITNANTGAFVRTIRRQGESYGGHWNDHCSSWFDAVAGNAARYTVAPDGFTGATASTYTAPNSPFTQTWNCKDANGNTVPDGNYKIWIQYAEDDDGAQGPVTTNGLLWTKGATASTVNPPDQGDHFTNMTIKWTPGAASGTPEIAVQQPVGSNLVDGKSKKSFGTVKLGSKNTKTFTIKNVGKAKLKGFAITINGANASDFSAIAPTVTTLAPGASTTFKVTFKPRAKGIRAAAIHIKNNDANENPFDIKLGGEGVK